MDQETFEQLTLDVLTEIDDEGYAHVEAILGPTKGAVIVRKSKSTRTISRSPKKGLAYALIALGEQLLKEG